MASASRTLTDLFRVCFEDRTPTLAEPLPQLRRLSLGHHLCSVLQSLQGYYEDDRPLMAWNHLNSKVIKFVFPTLVASPKPHHRTPGQKQQNMPRHKWTNPRWC